MHDQAQSQQDPVSGLADATASAEPDGEETEELPFPGQHVPSPKSAASPKVAATPKSASSQGKPKTSTDRSVLVNNSVEGPIVVTLFYWQGMVDWKLSHNLVVWNNS